MHQHRIPTTELSHLVKRIYEVKIPKPSTFDENRIIPMGTGTITFVLKGEAKIKSNGSIHHGPNYTLSGQYFPTFSFASNSPLLFYGIALKPTATYKLFDIYLSEIQNDFINLNEVIGDGAKELRQKLLHMDTTEERFDLLEDFLLKKLPVSPTYTHLDVIIDLIYQKHGILKVKDLCDHKDISRRYLEKKFNTHIGFTPGQFIRQVRFNFTCAQLAESKEPVKDILLKYGYYDRSHFMKSFKKYYGSDLSVLTGDDDSLFKVIFSRIMRSDSENSYHP